MYEYAVKLFMGNSPGTIAAKGAYWTAINILNPGVNKDAEFTYQVSIAAYIDQGGIPSAASQTSIISPFSKPQKLTQHESMEIDRAEIIKVLKPKKDFFLKGFVIINSDYLLDVVAVYTASPIEKDVVAIHTERVPPRKI